MSADNYIYINEKTLEVWSCVASCVCGHKRHHLTEQKGSLIGKGKTLKDAIQIAKKYDRKLEREGIYVEYGINFKLWCK